MICYKDKAFTTDPNCRCARKLTDEVIAAAERWWGKPGAPVQIVPHCLDCSKTVPASGRLG